jgi:hypothetical protein
MSLQNLMMIKLLINTQKRVKVQINMNNKLPRDMTHKDISTPSYIHEKEYITSKFKILKNNCYLFVSLFILQIFLF